MYATAYSLYKVETITLQVKHQTKRTKLILHNYTYIHVQCCFSFSTCTLATSGHISQRLLYTLVVELYPFLLGSVTEEASSQGFCPERCDHAGTCRTTLP